MDMKVYKRTRYQNIYKHKKNSNYIISISKPVKTSISRDVEDNKIYDINIALKIRDNPKIRTIKGKETTNKEMFDDVYIKYLDYCKNVQKLAYNTINKKKKIYKKHLKGKINKKVTKINKEWIANFINNLNTTDKQKNEILKNLSAFFSWCKQEEIIIISPTEKIKKHKIPKAEMKFLIPEEINKLLDVLNKDINDITLKVDQRKKAYIIKMLILIECSTGNRIGETRALSFNKFSKNKQTAKINHSINYNTKDNNFFSTTKTKNSDREINITDNLIKEILNYKNFLIDIVGLNVKDCDLLFFNYSTNKPYSDSYLREIFHEYCDKASITKIRLYDLRHTYVALMMSEGVELYKISSRIGHINYSTTVNKYGHLSTQTKKETAQITDKYLF